MRARALSMALLVACAISASACAAVKPALVAPSDYAAYRRYRLATGLGERMSAAWAYLRDEPDGEFRVEVMRWFGPTEAQFFAEAGRTPGGAAAYLALLPDGPHAEEEATFLRAFEKDKLEGPMRAQHAMEEARKKAEAARKAEGEAIELWTRRAAAISAWGEPMASFEKTDKAFVDALAEDPKASCNADGCVKTLYFRYPIPDASPAEDRVVPIVVRLELTEGRVAAVSIVAPQGGFTWWLEGVEARAVDPFDVAERGEAITRAKNRIEVVTRDALKASTCTTTEEANVRRIECGRLRVVVEATPNGDDLVRVVGL